MSSKNEMIEMWLCSILQCGTDDLQIIDCGYEYDEIMQDCIDTYGRIELNALSCCIVNKGRDELQEAITERINELEEYMDEDECFDRNDEYQALLLLDPYDDIEEYHNYIDTSVWFKQYADEYRKYLPKAVEMFEEHTGYALND